MKGKVGPLSPKKQARKVIRMARAHAPRQDLGLAVTEEQFMDFEVLPDPRRVYRLSILVWTSRRALTHGHIAN